MSAEVKKVSIVIAVYNSEKYLKDSIDSLLNQTYPNIEIIAVLDDGSTDNSEEILKKFSEKIKIIKMPHGRVASAYNEGIKVMTGEWLKVFNDDDIMYPDAIFELVTEAKKIQDKSKTILVGNYDVIDSKGGLITEKLEEKNLNQLSLFDINVILLDHMIGSPGASLIHRSTIDECGMFNEKIDYEDYEYWLRCCLLHKHRLHFIQKKILQYRIHPGQTTKTKVKQGQDVRNKLRNTILCRMKSSERKKYELGLKQYKKRKTITEKIKFFVRYKLCAILPSTISSKIIDTYWVSQKLKSS